MKKIILLSLALVLLAGTAALVYASSTSIGWDVIAGGGGSASSGDVTIKDTIGQPVIGLSQAAPMAIGSGFWYGFAPAKPRAITDLAIAKASGKAKLDWSAITTDVNGNALGSVTYNVYRAMNTPYFTPGAPYASGVTSATYTDPDATVLGDASKNAYYIVRAVSAGLEGDDSNRVGTFNFTLVPGSP